MLRDTVCVNGENWCISDIGATLTPKQNIRKAEVGLYQVFLR